MANPCLHNFLSLFEPLYMKGSRELWHYDENGNVVLAPHNRGVRQGCVQGMFLICLTMEPVNSRMRAKQGTLYAY
jgi:hypothetical protein